jgi:hypothetical protein
MTLEMKIEDITVTDKHVGEVVTYIPPHAKGNAS